jgi:glycosyltransferase involved in cell wall biosynthesis
MNILMHCVYFPPEVGGLESHVYQLCRWFVRHGHQVGVVTSRSLPEMPSYEDMDGIRVWRTWFPSRNPTGWALHSAGSIPRLVRQAREADVVHAQAFASVLPGVMARRRHGTPLVTSFHTSHFLRRAERPGWKGVLGRLVRASDYAMAASVEIAEVAEGLAPGVRVEPFTNGIDTEEFRRTEPTLPPPAGGRRRVIAARRLFEKNGVEFLIRATPIMAESVDVEVVLVGDGPERDRLEALTVELGVQDRVRFMGKRPNTEVPGLLSSAEIAVFPSLMEATSVAALEAMSCELPIAATRVGGLAEIVDEAVGAHCRPGDPTDLARAVVSLLERGDLREMGARGRARVEERWSVDRLGERHLEVYEMVIEARGRRR